MHAGDELIAIRRPASGRRAASSRTRSCRTTSRSTAADHQLVILTGPEHGRQVDLPASDRAALPAWRRPARSCRRATAKIPIVDRTLRARRRVRQHRARPVDVHGGDAGDREHPAQRHVAQPRHPRRDRPRHGDLRRPEPRLGGRRAPGVGNRRPGPRRSSPRTITSSPTSPTRCPASSTSTSSSASGRTTSSSCGRSSPGRSDRSYGIQVARLAGLPPAVVDRAREILNGARARRAVARRTAVTERQRRARSSSSACSRRRLPRTTRCVRGCARWTSTT